MCEMETKKVECSLVIQIVFFILPVVQCKEVCEIHATIIRRIENEGFHRDIHSLVEIVTGYSTPWGDCMVILEESMPSGLYINPDQLSDLRHFGQVQACPVGMVDIEAPEKDSLPHSVHVYSSLNRTENLLSASLTLPFHIRYHSPIPHGGYSTVRLGAPSLLLNCQNGMQCVQGKRIHAPCRPCSRELCQWVNLAYKTNSPSISLPVPVGNSSHHVLVIIVTLLVTCAGCFYILSAIADAWPRTVNVTKTTHAEVQFPRPSTLSHWPDSCIPSHN